MSSSNTDTNTKAKANNFDAFVPHGAKKDVVPGACFPTGRGVVFLSAPAPEKGEGVDPSASGISTEDRRGQVDPVPSTEEQNGARTAPYTELQGVLDWMIVDSGPGNAFVNDAGVNLDVTDYCPWMDKALTLEQRVNAHEAWATFWKETQQAYRVQGFAAAACWKCGKLHHQPHIDKDRFTEVSKAAAEVKKLWNKEPRSKPKGNSAPMCRYCGRDHWPAKKGRACRAPQCSRCQYNHYRTETCLDAQNRMRAAGLILKAPESPKLSKRQEITADYLAKLVVNGELSDLDSATCGKFINDSFEWAAGRAGNVPPSFPHRSRKRKQKTDDSSDVDSDDPDKGRKKKEKKIKIEDE
jgi:hypothetical protein